MKLGRESLILVKYATAEATPSQDQLRFMAQMIPRQLIQNLLRKSVLVRWWCFE